MSNVAGDVVTSQPSSTTSNVAGEVNSSSSSSSSAPSAVDIEVAGAHDLTISSTLGSGSFGSVHAGVDDLTNDDVAVKIVAFADDDVEGERELFLNEVEAMLALGGSPWTVGLYRHALDEDAKVGVIVMDRADGADLTHYLTEAGDRLPHHHTIWISTRIARALADVHAAGLVHRDVKLDNVLVYSSPSSSIATVKLADFGLVVPTDIDTEVAPAGTLDYMPSSLVSSWEHEDHPAPQPRPSDDMFSFGVVVLELMGAGSELDRWNRRRRRQIRAGRRPSEFTIPPSVEAGYDEALVEAIGACLDDDERMRPTSGDMVELLESLTCDVGGSPPLTMAEGAYDDDDDGDGGCCRLSVGLVRRRASADGGAIADRVKRRRHGSA